VEHPHKTCGNVQTHKPASFVDDDSGDGDDNDGQKSSNLPSF